MKKDHELLEASRTGSIEVVKKLVCPPRSSTRSIAASFGIKVGANVNCQDQSGYTPLHHAALNGHREVVEFLLQNSASVNISDLKGNYPLHLAAWSGYHDIVNILLTHGPSVAKVNDMNGDSESALHCASQHGHVKAVEVLLRNGADPSVRNIRGESPLDLASQYGRLEVVRLLLHHQPSLLKRFPECFSPLHLASRNGHKEVVELLLVHGADINKNGENGSALHEAALFGKLDVVKLLLTRGANPHALDPQNRSPLQLVKELDTKTSRDISQLILYRLQEGEDYEPISGDGVANPSLTPSSLRHFLESSSPDSLECGPAFIDGRRKPAPELRQRLPEVTVEEHHVTSGPAPSVPVSRSQTFRGFGWSRSSFGKGGFSLRRSASVRSSKSLPRLPSARSKSPASAATSPELSPTFRIRQNHPSSTMFPVSTNYSRSIRRSSSTLPATTLSLLSLPITSSRPPDEEPPRCRREPLKSEDDNVFLPTPPNRSRRRRTKRSRSLDPHSPRDQHFLASENNQETLLDDSPLTSDDSHNQTSVNDCGVTTPQTPSSAAPKKPSRQKHSSVTSTPPPIPPKPINLNINKKRPPSPQHPPPPDEDYESEEEQESLYNKENGREDESVVISLKQSSDVMNETSNSYKFLLATQPTTSVGMTPSCDQCPPCEVGSPSLSPPSPRSAMMEVSEALQKAVIFRTSEANRTPNNNCHVQFVHVASSVEMTSASTDTTTTVSSSAVNGGCAGVVVEDGLVDTGNNLMTPPLKKADLPKRAKPPVAAKPRIKPKPVILTTKLRDTVNRNVPDQTGSKPAPNMHDYTVKTNEYSPGASDCNGEAIFQHSNDPDLTPTFIMTVDPLLGSGVVASHSEQQNVMSPVDEETTPVNDITNFPYIVPLAPPDGESKKIFSTLEDVSESEVTSSGGDTGTSEFNDALSDRTEDFELPNQYRMFRGLIRGASYSTKNYYIDSDCSETYEDDFERSELQLALRNSMTRLETDDKVLMTSTQKRLLSGRSDGGDSPHSTSSAEDLERSGKEASSDCDSAFDFKSRTSSVYDNSHNKPNLVKQSIVESCGMPDLNTIKHTVAVVRSSPLKGNSSSTPSTIANKLPSNAATEGDEWAQIANIVTSLSGGLDKGSVYVKEFEETFWQIMTGSNLPRQISTWLAGLGLPQYERVLTGSGFDNVDFLADGILEDQDLIDMNIVDVSHRRRILDSAQNLPKPHSLPPSDSVQAPNSVTEWLSTLQLSQYASVFTSAGVHDMNEVRGMTASQIKSIISLRGHSKRILSSLKATPQALPPRKLSQAKLSPPLSRSPLLESVNFFKDYNSIVNSRSAASFSTRSGTVSSTSSGSNNIDSTLATCAGNKPSSPRKTSLQSAQNSDEHSSNHCRRKKSTSSHDQVTGSDRRPSSSSSKRSRSQRLKSRSSDTKKTRSSSTSGIQGNELSVYIDNRRSSSERKEGKMSSEASPVASVPDAERATFLASKASGKGINLRPPNETTREVSVSAWRHPPEVLINSCCNYQAYYLGSMLIHELKGTSSTMEACAKMRKSTDAMKKIPTITLSINYRGVKFIDFKTKHQIAEHEIQNISFASQDSDDLSTFAYMTHDVKTGHHYCHVFRVTTMDMAYEVILTLGQAFEVAYQLILKDKALKESQST